LAADQGLPVAQFDLAYMYEEAKGVNRDPQRAAKLYESAALGIITARHNLAYMYSSGEFLAKDMTTAYKWALLDVSGENMRVMTGKTNREDEPRLGYALIQAKSIAKHMTRNERKSAHNMAEGWIRSNTADLGEEPKFFALSVERLK